MRPDTHYLLGPKEFREFIDNFEYQDDIPERLRDGSFIAQAVMDAPAPDETEIDLKIIGLNGQVFDAGRNDNEYDAFISALTGQTVMIGKDMTETDTVVLFRRDEEGEITAVMPFEQGSPDMMICYAHIGQHGSCHIDWVKETFPASEDEYRALKAELTSAPFDYKFLILDDLTAIDLEEQPTPAPTL
ncbi:hypothetical protein [Rhizobium sp. MHM7A]|uniref:hypothetical protein n=1 Tax=Rhizobium sp. MHM7A TaxID=2583233 RepID=UPI00110589F4|nr:hypothetical protein [Rhizobium sp. MHM7A]TLX15972.1 hypothetical protein FFR93_01255 [Rhizobium sp. MHM7A]